MGKITAADHQAGGWFFELQIYRHIDTRRKSLIG